MATANQHNNSVRKLCESVKVDNSALVLTTVDMNNSRQISNDSNSGRDGDNYFHSVTFDKEM